MKLPGRVRIVEVGPRDGLQNESVAVSTENKAALIDLLADAGLTSIEAGSFVSTKAAPQMASTADVLARVRPRPGCPPVRPRPQSARARGRAQSRGAGDRRLRRRVGDVFSKQHQLLDREKSRALRARRRAGDATWRRGARLCVLRPWAALMRARSRRSGSRRSRARFPTSDVMKFPLAIRSASARHCARGELIETVAREVPLEQLAIHFHDTYGQALANIFACLEAGVSVVDSSVAGLGGCPHAPGATGNVATEDVIYMLDGMGHRNGRRARRLARGRRLHFAMSRPSARQPRRASFRGQSGKGADRPRRTLELQVASVPATVNV